MDEIEKTQQQITEAMEQPKQEMVTMVSSTGWGSQVNSPENRGFATFAGIFTSEQINGEVKFLTMQYYEGLTKLSNQNQQTGGN